MEKRTSTERIELMKRCQRCGLEIFSLYDKCCVSCSDSTRNELCSVNAKSDVQCNVKVNGSGSPDVSLLGFQKKFKQETNRRISEKFDVTSVQSIKASPPATSLDSLSGSVLKFKSYNINNNDTTELFNFKSTSVQESFLSPRFSLETVETIDSTDNESNKNNIEKNNDKTDEELFQMETNITCQNELQKLELLPQPNTISSFEDRCTCCDNKLPIIKLKCKCGNYYCQRHQFAEDHNCTFDYKGEFQNKLRKMNKPVVGTKIRKI